MRKNTLIFLSILTFIAFIFISCSDDTTSVPDPSINLTFPNGGDSLGLGVSYKITWTDEIDENINIELYKGQDENAVKILSFSNVPNSGEYDFLVPFDSDTDGDYKIKLVSVADSTIYDTSKDYFGFTGSVGDSNDQPEGAVEIYVPHTGDYAVYPSGDIDWFKVFLNSGQKYIFENSSADDFDTEFYLYKGNAEGTGISDLLLTDDDSGSGLQPYMEYSPSEDGYYFLRVSLFSNDPSKTKRSDVGYYTLSVTESISLLSPNGGEVWEHDSINQITWDPDLAGNIVLSLLEGSEVILDIATANGSDGSYSWTIPENISSGINYKIRIQSADNQDSMDESDNFFAITGNDSLTNVAGVWNVQGSWEKWEGVWTFSDDGTWSNSWGTSGTWQLKGDIIQWYYDSGTSYTGLVEGDSMSGYMSDGLGLNGTWTAQRNIITR